MSIAKNLIKFHSLYFHLANIFSLYLATTHQTSQISLFIFNFSLSSLLSPTHLRVDPITLSTPLLLSSTQELSIFMTWIICDCLIPSGKWITSTNQNECYVHLHGHTKKSTRSTREIPKLSLLTQQRKIKRHWGGHLFPRHQARGKANIF